MADSFESLARRPDAELPLVRGALLIAREEYPDLDIDVYGRRVDRLADAAREHVRPGATRRAVEDLNAFFFGRERFHGNRDDYYDPRNSYLNDVLERRTGIPITLSVLYVEVGRRLGLPLTGVGFPGRYLVRCAPDTLIDCFDARLLDRDGCRELLDTMYAGSLRLNDEMLRDSTARETLGRVLANLRGVFIQRGDLRRALRFSDLGVAVQQDRAEPLRERAAILIRLEQFGRAVADLEEVVRRAPDAKDGREQLALARTLLARIN